MPIDDDVDDDSPRADSPDIALTMTASAMLQDLPQDATAALASAGTFSQEKVTVRFKPTGAAPPLSQEISKINATRKFEEIVRYLRRKLKSKDTDSVFLYVNDAFAPSLDEVVGNLHQVSAGHSCISSHHSGWSCGLTGNPVFQESSESACYFLCYYSGLWMKMSVALSFDRYATAPQTCPKTRLIKTPLNATD